MYTFLLYNHLPNVPNHPRTQARSDVFNGGVLTKGQSAFGRNISSQLIIP